MALKEELGTKSQNFIKYLNNNPQKSNRNL